MSLEVVQIGDGDDLAEIVFGGESFERDNDNTALNATVNSLVRVGQNLTRRKHVGRSLHDMALRVHQHQMGGRWSYPLHLRPTRPLLLSPLFGSSAQRRAIA